MMSDRSMGNYENDSNRGNSFKSAGELVNNLIDRNTDRHSGRLMSREPDF